uniref:Putative ovule protein n=1 Tax=Solanum chacoense TaxID=4108 RepID=A0A0V0HQT2_SOLCH
MDLGYYVHHIHALSVTPTSVSNFDNCSRSSAFGFPSSIDQSTNSRFDTSCYRVNFLQSPVHNSHSYTTTHPYTSLFVSWDLGLFSELSKQSAHRIIGIITPPFITLLEYTKDLELHDLQHNLPYPITTHTGLPVVVRRARGVPGTCQDCTKQVKH